MAAFLKDTTTLLRTFQAREKQAAPLLLSSCVAEDLQ